MVIAWFHSRPVHKTFKKGGMSLRFLQRESKEKLDFGAKVMGVNLVSSKITA